MKLLKLLIPMPLKHPGEISSISNSFMCFFSSYPLILCIELQCSIGQQERTAQLLMETFSEKLFLSNPLLPTDRDSVF